MGSGLKPSPFYLLRKIAQIAVSEPCAATVAVEPPECWTRSDRLPGICPGIAQEVAPNESRRTPKRPNRETLIYEVLFVARWLRSRFEKGS